MSRKTIEVIVRPDGSLAIDAVGFKGTDCVQATAFLEDIAEFGAPVVLFSGGEPLTRTDLFDLAPRAVSLGLRAVISTNGTLITPETADIRRARPLQQVSHVGACMSPRWRGGRGA